MAKELLVSIKNDKLSNWLGDPLTITTQEADGSLKTTHADVADIIKNFMRARGQDGQSLVVKSLEDAQRVRVIGMALQEHEDGVLRIPFGEHKWLVDKAKEVGFRFLPNDIPTLIDALEAGQKTNAPVETELL